MTRFTKPANCNGGPRIQIGDLSLDFDRFDPISDALEISKAAGFSDDDINFIARVSSDLFALTIHAGGRRGRELSVWLHSTDRVLVGRGFASTEVRELMEIAA